MKKNRKKLTYDEVYKASGDFIIGNKKVIELLKEAINEQSKNK
jgi:hypothetical protein